MGRLLLFIFLAAGLSADVAAVYLSWYGDPTTTMTVQWLTSDTDINDTVYLQTKEGAWQEIEGDQQPLQTILVHHAFLDQLTPDTEYRFRVGDDSTEYLFRTAPAKLSRPLRFIIGGDAYSTKKIFRRMNQTIVEQDPLFCVIGGDIAYALRPPPFYLRVNSLKRWISFLTEWTEQLVSSEGRLIPFLLVPGNHDLSSDQYDLFFSLFAFPKRQLYRALDFGSYLSLILLDTNHFQPIEGQQTLWLNKALSERGHIPYRFAVYHEAAYPSYYPYNGSIPRKIRTHWCPLFDKHHLTAAFENHNHAYKKTYPLKNGEIDQDEGIIYFGDGCWGTNPRKTNDLWYLEKRARKNNVYLLEISPESAEVKALDIVGNVLDSTSLLNR